MEYFKILKILKTAMSKGNLQLQFHKPECPQLAYTFFDETQLPKTLETNEISERRLYKEFHSGSGVYN
jgi:hypothetical protein